MADQTAGSGDPALVMIDLVPHVYALHSGGRIDAWVFVLPNGDALVIDTDGTVTAHTTLERIQARQARRGGRRLVEVMEYPAELRAA
jgi:hypothetical protein